MKDFHHPSHSGGKLPGLWLKEVTIKTWLGSQWNSNKTIPIRSCSYLIIIILSSYPASQSGAIKPKLHPFIFRWTAGQMVAGCFHYLPLMVAFVSFVNTQITNSMNSFVRRRTKHCVLFFWSEEQHFDNAWWTPSCACLIFQLMSDHLGSQNISEDRCRSKPRQREGMRTRDANVRLQHLADGKNSQTWPLAIWRVTRVS